MEGVAIRAFDLERDYEGALELWRSAGPGLSVGRSDTRAELAKKLERDPDLFLVAEAGGLVIGTVIGAFDGRRGIIYHLTVAEAHRRRGLGARLMQEVEARLRAKGCWRAWLAVTPENLAVIDFYQRLGWDPMPVQFLAKNLDEPARPD